MDNNVTYPRGVEVIVGPFILNKKKEILLFKSPKWQGQWIVCGGHVEPGETMVDAVKRETKEEIGVDIEVGEIFNIGEGFATPPEFKRNAHMIFINFMAELKSEDYVFSEEISECKWFDINEILSSQDIKPSCRSAIEKLKEHLFL